MPANTAVRDSKNGNTSTNDDKGEVRYTLGLKNKFKGKIVDFANSQDLQISDVLRQGAQAYVNGYLPVLGRIPCGPLEEAIEETPHYELVPPFLKPRADLGDFLLEADGDSMSPRIERADLVMLRPGIEAGQGEVCAVQVYDETGGSCKSTLKKLYRDFTTDEYELRPINPLYPSERVPSKRLQIVGVCRGILTKDS